MAAPFVAAGLDLGAIAKVSDWKGALRWEVVVDAREEVVWREKAMVTVNSSLP